ncbi:MAG: M48 family metallopeptidase [Saprospiraceae bacterium]
MDVILYANYFFGIKPKGIPSKVKLLKEHFEIQYEFENKNEIRSWEVVDILPDFVSQEQNLILKYGIQHPFEFLEFEDLKAYQLLSEMYPDKKWRKDESKLFKNPLSIAAGFTFFFIVLCIVGYFWIMPKLADGLTKVVPLNWEIELGSKLSESSIPKALENTTKSMMLDSFFKLMQVESKYPIQFHYIEDTIVNAFAMPGGNIVIYSGLFNKLNSYESLAGLIGHEFTHVEFKHSLKTIFRSMSSYIILAAIFGDLTGLAGIVLENANSIQNLSYSRAFEKEADANAIDLLLDRKISLVGMLDLFKVFMDEGKQGLTVPKFLSTHPITEDRIKFVESKMGTRESGDVEHKELKELYNRLKNKK